MADGFGGRVVEGWRSLSVASRILIAIFATTVVGYIILLCSWHPLDKGAARIVDRIASGKPVPPHYYIPVWGYYAAVANLVVSALGLGIALWWGRKMARRSIVPAPLDTTERSAPLPTPVLISALLAIVVGMFLNSPRMHQSFWGDEERTLKSFTVGHYESKLTDSGIETEFDPVSWRYVFFDYRSTNNHILYSVVAKLSHHLFHRPSDDPDRNFFTEWTLRLPAFIAAFLGILALAWALCQLGFGRAAFWAPWLLVAHAWFTRFSTDARGYGMVILFSALLIGTVADVIRRPDRWRPWICLGILSFAMMYTYPGAIYSLGLLHVVALLGVWFSRPKPDHSAQEIRATKIDASLRWLFCGLGAALIFAQLFGPCIPQMREYMDRVFDAGMGPPLTAKWVADVGAYLLVGDAWFPWDPVNPMAQTLSRQFATSPLRMTLGLGAAIIVFVTGVVTLARQRMGWSWLLAFLGSPVLVIVHALAEERFLYHWYLVPSVIGFVAISSIGLATISGWIKTTPERRMGRFVQVAVALILVVLVWIPGGRRSQLLRSRSMEPLREGVAMYRTVRNPTHPDFGRESLSAHVLMYTEGYDGAAVRTKSPAALRDLMAESDATGKPLFIHMALPEIGKLVIPDMMDIILDPNQFERIATLYGLYQPCSREIYHYVGSGTGSL